MSRQLKLVHVVVGILLQNGKMLVAERPEGKPYSGYWEFPGGKIEPNESSVDALIRELKEELGIEPLGAQFLFQHQHDYPDKTVLLDLYLVTDFHGDPEGKEGQRLAWVDANSLAQLNLLKGNLAILNRITALFLK